MELGWALCGAPEGSLAHFEKHIWQQRNTNAQPIAKPPNIRQMRSSDVSSGDVLQDS